LVLPKEALVTRFLARIAVAMLLAVPAAAQVPDQEPAPQPSAPQSENELLEEDYIRTRMENGESHASGARPDLGPVVLGNPTQAVVTLRVGLYFSILSSTGGLVTEFSSLHHPYVELTNTDGDVKVIDRTTGKEIAAMSAGSRVRVEHDGTGFLVSQDGAPIGSFAGPVFFRPASTANLFRVESIRRSFSGTKVPLYRGAIEVARGRITAGQVPPKVNLVNILEVEDYVPGVVANESIASFSPEALKAQAVAARGYAIANIGNYVARGYPFDIVDSSSSQVYRGVISEHVNAVRAASETVGLVAAYDGQIISALYSSSFGGHSEDNEWIFNSPSTQLPGTNVTPYLRGIYDGIDPAPDFTNEVGINAFWRTNPMLQLYDECTTSGNSFSRWTFTLPGSLIKSRLTTSNSVLVSGSRDGAITNVAIAQRMPASARAAIVTLTLTTGVVEVRGWDNLRSVLGRNGPTQVPRACGTSKIAANFVLDNPSSFDVVNGPDGTVSQVTVYGGGWGHNLGMSQYGAHGRGKAGQSFLEILHAYYTGVDIGSYPIDIGLTQGSGAPTLRQEFVAPNALGTVEIRATDLKSLRVHVNGLYDLSFDQATLASGVVRVDISQYLIAGLNVIQYNPVGLGGRATVNVVVR
jgi:SpoIID/LytB domain protein